MTIYVIDENGECVSVGFDSMQDALEAARYVRGHVKQFESIVALREHYGVDSWLTRYSDDELLSDRASNFK